ncbi:hypothetical protein Nmel_003112, partial [Mimus melanotis]
MFVSRMENHCFLLFVFVFQAIFILILYRGGPSNVFRRFLESPQVVDYSKPHDVYTNLSLFTRAPNEDTMPSCSAPSPVLVGPLTITFRVLPSERMIMERNNFIQSAPAAQLHYLIQQVGTGSFIRAKLRNVGIREAMKDEEWACLVLHDTDLVPENDYNLYICDEYCPKHTASAMDKFQYTLPYNSFFGGVSALTPEHYMNGFPNTYWGDGGMKIVQTSPHLGCYQVIDYNEETEIQEPWR